MKLHFDIAKKGRNSTQVSFISYFFPQNDNLLTLILHLPTFLNWQANSRPYQITF